MTIKVAELAQPVPEQNSNPFGAALRVWSRHSNWAVNLSVVILLLLVMGVLLANVITSYDPSTINLRERLSPPVWQGGTMDHPLGTDATGRDIFTRILYGGRVSLMVGGVSTLLGLAVGTILGIVAGFIRGWFDQVVMYLVDVQLSLPFLLLAVAVALVLGTSLTVLIFMAALATWPVYTRVVRGAVLSLREREFVTAARAVGATNLHIMWQHLLPNLIAPLLVLATLSIGRIILLESGLSFLGIGVQPPTPSWGNMINEGREYLSTAWWLAAMPGAALMLLTMAVGTLGDWLRDLMDVAIG